jgi:hypothetical protein
VLSTVDPRARHTRKSPENRRDGYRAHVAAEPETGLITDERLTKAAGIDNSDPAVAEQFLDREGEPCTWYGDSAYGTGDLRGAINDAEHQAVIKPKPLPAPVPGGFTIDDFTVDEPAGTVTCPAGNTRPISRTRVATFGALCRDCPLRQRCTKSNTGRKIVLRDRDDLLRQARRDWVAKAAGPVPDQRCVSARTVEGCRRRSSAWRVGRRWRRWRRSRVGGRLGGSVGRLRVVGRGGWWGR